MGSWSAGEDRSGGLKKPGHGFAWIHTDQTRYTHAEKPLLDTILYAGDTRPFAQNAKERGTRLADYGGGSGLHRSFVGSPWLCQGLRCLRMTGFDVD